MLYRIITENKNRKTIERLIASQFEGFTIFKAEGFWRLQKENSLIIEIETADPGKKIRGLAETIKKSNKQEAILIQEIKNNAYLI